MDSSQAENLEKEPNCPRNLQSKNNESEGDHLLGVSKYGRVRKSTAKDYHSIIDKPSPKTSKEEMVVEMPGSSCSEQVVNPKNGTKKGVGRPRKIIKDLPKESSFGSSQIKRSRGRPRKIDKESPKESSFVSSQITSYFSKKVEKLGGSSDSKKSNAYESSIEVQAENNSVILPSVSNIVKNRKLENSSGKNNANLDTILTTDDLSFDELTSYICNDSDDDDIKLSLIAQRKRLSINSSGQVSLKSDSMGVFGSKKLKNEDASIKTNNKSHTITSSSETTLKTSTPIQGYEKADNNCNNDALLENPVILRDKSEKSDNNSNEMSLNTKISAEKGDIKLQNKAISQDNSIMNSTSEDLNSGIIFRDDPVMKADLNMKSNSSKLLKFENNGKETITASLAKSSNQNSDGDILNETNLDTCETPDNLTPNLLKDEVLEMKDLLTVKKQNDVLLNGNHLKRSTLSKEKSNSDLQNDIGFNDKELSNYLENIEMSTNLNENFLDSQLIQDISFNANNLKESTLNNSNSQLASDANCTFTDKSKSLNILDETIPKTDVAGQSSNFLDETVQKTDVTGQSSNFLDETVPKTDVSELDESQLSINNANLDSETNEFRRYVLKSSKTTRSDWKIGDIVWSRVNMTSILWPSVVVNCPYENDYYQGNANAMSRPKLHVRFLADRGRRSWTNSKYAMPFKGKKQFDEISASIELKDMGKYKNHASGFKRYKQTVSWHQAIEEADKLMEKTVEERLAFFEELLEKALVQKLERSKLNHTKRKSLATPGSSSKANYEKLDPDNQTVDNETTPKDSDSCSEISSIAYLFDEQAFDMTENELIELIKSEYSDFRAKKLKEVSTPETFSFISLEEFYEQVKDEIKQEMPGVSDDVLLLEAKKRRKNKRDGLRKVWKKKFKVENCSDLLFHRYFEQMDRTYFQNNTEIDENQIKEIVKKVNKNKKEKERRKIRRLSQNEPTVETKANRKSLGQSDAEKRKPERNEPPKKISTNLFAGLAKRNACSKCFKPGFTVLCSGTCLRYYHQHCGYNATENNEAVDNNNTNGTNMIKDSNTNEQKQDENKNTMDGLNVGVDIKIPQDVKEIKDINGQKQDRNESNSLNSLGDDSKMIFDVRCKTNEETSCDQTLDCDDTVFLLDKTLKERVEQELQNEMSNGLNYTGLQELPNEMPKSLNYTGTHDKTIQNYVVEVASNTNSKSSTNPEIFGLQSRKSSIKSENSIAKSSQSNSDNSETISPEDNFDSDTISSSQKSKINSALVSVSSTETNCTANIKIPIQISRKSSTESEVSIAKSFQSKSDKSEIESISVASSSNSNPVQFKIWCADCSIGRSPACFACGKYSNGDGENRVKCGIKSCGKYYHLTCLKVYQQLTKKGIRTSTSRNSKSDEESFFCPLHKCHTCTSEDVNEQVSSLTKESSVQCIECPTAFHRSNHCLAAGSMVLSTKSIHCPRHLQNQVKKRKMHSAVHINANWCFICSEGGDLICCETCPLCVHAKCAKVTIPEEGYICDNCESGRFPLYGEIVWAKLGNYRWWPAQILFPYEIPENLLKNFRSKVGVFMVRFFGTNDYYPLNRGRVFSYQEEDRNNSSKTTGAQQASYNVAVLEAAKAFDIYKAAKIERYSVENRTGLKPPPYVKISRNKPYGKVKIFDNDSNDEATRCFCDPDSADPCGFDSNCLNRLLFNECDPEKCCNKCKNQQFERRKYPKLSPFLTTFRGWGLKTDEPLTKGQFIIEYVGEIISHNEYKRRTEKMAADREDNFYFLTIDGSRMIDAGPKGNVSRFMNHSCQPNCESQKWTVYGDTRIGLFALDDIPAGTELTFNYNWESIGKEKKQCRCGAPNCSGFIGVKVNAHENDKKSKPNEKKLLKKKGLQHNELSRPTKKISTCFICGENKPDGICALKKCSKFYHLKCVDLESKWPEKWTCPRHKCAECSRVKHIVTCQKCPRAFCRLHQDGNIVLDSNFGDYCSKHPIEKKPDKNKIKQEDVENMPSNQKQPKKRKRNASPTELASNIKTELPSLENTVVIQDNSLDFPNLSDMASDDQNRNHLGLNDTTNVKHTFKKQRTQILDTDFQTNFFQFIQKKEVIASDRRHFNSDKRKSSLRKQETITDQNDLSILNAVEDLKINKDTKLKTEPMNGKDRKINDDVNKKEQLDRTSHLESLGDFTNSSRLNRVVNSEVSNKSIINVVSPRKCNPNEKMSIEINVNKPIQYLAINHLCVDKFLGSAGEYQLQNDMPVFANFDNNTDQICTISKKSSNNEPVVISDDDLNCEEQSQSSLTIKHDDVVVLPGSSVNDVILLDSPENTQTKDEAFINEKSQLNLNVTEQDKIVVILDSPEKSSILPDISKTTDSDIDYLSESSTNLQKELRSLSDDNALEIEKMLQNVEVVLSSDECVDISDEENEHFATKPTSNSKENETKFVSQNSFVYSGNNIPNVYDRIFDIEDIIEPSFITSSVNVKLPDEINKEFSGENTSLETNYRTSENTKQIILDTTVPLFGGKTGCNSLHKKLNEKSEKLFIDETEMNKIADANKIAAANKIAEANDILIKKNTNCVNKTSKYLKTIKLRKTSKCFKKHLSKSKEALNKTRLDKRKIGKVSKKNRFNNLKNQLICAEVQKAANELLSVEKLVDKDLLGESSNPNQRRPKYKMWSKSCNSHRKESNLKLFDQLEFFTQCQLNLRLSKSTVDNLAKYMNRSYSPTKPILEVSSNLQSSEMNVLQRETISFNNPSFETNGIAVSSVPPHNITEVNSAKEHNSPKESILENGTENLDSKSNKQESNTSTNCNGEKSIFNKNITKDLTNSSEKSSEIIVLSENDDNSSINSDCVINLDESTCHSATFNKHNPKTQKLALKLNTNNANNVFEEQNQQSSKDKIVTEIDLLSDETDDEIIVEVNILDTINISNPDVVTSNITVLHSFVSNNQKEVDPENLNQNIIIGSSEESKLKVLNNEGDKNYGKSEILNDFANDSYRFHQNITISTEVEAGINVKPVDNNSPSKTETSLETTPFVNPPEKASEENFVKINNSNQDAINEISHPEKNIIESQTDTYNTLSSDNSSLKSDQTITNSRTDKKNEGIHIGANCVFKNCSNGIDSCENIVNESQKDGESLTIQEVNASTNKNEPSSYFVSGDDKIQLTCQHDQEQKLSKLQDLKIFDAYNDQTILNEIELKDMTATESQHAQNAEVITVSQENESSQNIVADNIKLQTNSKISFSQNNVNSLEEVKNVIEEELSLDKQINIQSEVTKTINDTKLVESQILEPPVNVDNESNLSNLSMEKSVLCNSRTDQNCVREEMGEDNIEDKLTLLINPNCGTLNKTSTSINDKLKETTEDGKGLLKKKTYKKILSRRFPRTRSNRLLIKNKITTLSETKLLNIDGQVETHTQNVTDLKTESLGGYANHELICNDKSNGDDEILPTSDLSDVNNLQYIITSNVNNSNTDASFSNQQDTQIKTSASKLKVSEVIGMNEILDSPRKLRSSTGPSEFFDLTVGIDGNLSNKSLLIEEVVKTLGVRSSSSIKDIISTQRSVSTELKRKKKRVRNVRNNKVEPLIPVNNATKEFNMSMVKDDIDVKEGNDIVESNSTTSFEEFSNIKNFPKQKNALKKITRTLKTPTTRKYKSMRADVEKKRRTFELQAISTTEEEKNSDNSTISPDSTLKCAIPISRLSPPLNFPSSRFFSKDIPDLENYSTPLPFKKSDESITKTTEMSPVRQFKTNRYQYPISSQNESSIKSIKTIKTKDIINMKDVNDFILSNNQSCKNTRKSTQLQSARKKIIDDTINKASQENEGFIELKEKEISDQTRIDTLEHHDDNSKSDSEENVKSILLRKPIKTKLIRKTLKRKNKDNNVVISKRYKKNLKKYSNSSSTSKTKKSKMSSPITTSSSLNFTMKNSDLSSDSDNESLFKLITISPKATQTKRNGSGRRKTRSDNRGGKAQFKQDDSVSSPNSTVVIEGNEIVVHSPNIPKVVLHRSDCCKK